MSEAKETHPEYLAGLAQGHTDAKGEISMLNALIRELDRFIESVRIGGNHLANHIDLDGPDWRAAFHEGLSYYGAGIRYDCWCCWKTIMQVRQDRKADLEDA